MWKGRHGEQFSLLAVENHVKSLQKIAALAFIVEPDNVPRIFVEPNRTKSPKMTHESENYRSNHLRSDLRPGRGAFASQLAGQTRTQATKYMIFAMWT